MASVRPKLSAGPRLRVVGQTQRGANGDGAEEGVSGPDPYIETLYEKYRCSLLNYLTGLLPGGRQDAYEVLHETYIRLLKQDNLERLEENARAYIFTVATNLVRDALRRRGSRRADAHIPFEEGEFPSTAPSPARAADWEQSLAKLKRELLKLPANTRQVFLLSRFEEMTYPEIARALNISTRTVERHMATAVRKLQNSLEDLL
ncbi:RNA polymerase sigma factor [Exilibacterium tricleocarpae]|uniref:RNA polymerase sigma factor n=1 Tax=Exilibacterium tricleocarpae TaxID=2591008 RepID=A0A545T8B7_9GAMM|nr:RNA polymerase sigma factor [Exilibacterium tricleocarpae]TQV73470.1 RNA polymerase sigma factor [Exilibacterium tricleocarpae]